MTDQQIDRVVEAAIPELKLALRSVLEGRAIHFFNIADGTNSQTGIRSKIVCFVAHDLAAAILEGTAEGIGKSQELTMERISQLQKSGGVQ